MKSLRERKTSLNKIQNRLNGDPSGASLAAAVEASLWPLVRGRTPGIRRYESFRHQSKLLTCIFASGQKRLYTPIVPSWRKRLAT